MKTFNESFSIARASPSSPCRITHGCYVTVASFCEPTKRGIYVNVFFCTWQLHCPRLERRRLLSPCVIVGNAAALSRKLRHCADILLVERVATFDVAPSVFFRVARRRAFYLSADGNRKRAANKKRRRGQRTITYWHESTSQESRCLTRASNSTRV